MQARAPRVSVVISTYNRKDSLKRAIKSVLAQSFDDFEIIVVDDCSTEDNKKLVTSFGDERVKYHRLGVNSGHDGKPKNIGILDAQGEYVCFLDDDDIWRQDALKILLTYAVETGVEVAYGDYLIGGKIGWSLDFSAARLNQQNYIAMDTVIVKRDWLLKVGGFDEKVPKFKDWNLWLRLHKMGARFMHIPIIVTELPAVNEGSISEKFSHDKDEAGRYLPTYFNPADCLIYPEVTSIAARKPLRVAIYTMTMNRLEYTKRMCKAMDETAGYPFDWYVIDQGSTDGTARVDQRPYTR
jgi:glycosyltransferase involved in cell wall biosynthesis